MDLGFLKEAAQFGPVVFVFCVGLVVAAGTIIGLVRMHYKEREINNNNHRKERDMWKADIKDILDRHAKEREKWREDMARQSEKVSDKLTETIIAVNRNRPPDS